MTARRVGRLEYLYYVIALIVVGRGFFVLFLGTKAGGAPLVAWGQGLITGLQVAVYMVAFALAVRYLPGVARTIARDPLLLLVQGFAAMTLLWSVSPERTLQGLVPFFGTAALAAVLTVRFRPRQRLRLVSRALALVILGSLAFVVALPSLAVASGGNEGSWQGVFEQKNMLGMIAALALVTFTSVSLLRPGWRRAAYVALWLGACACLVGSTSKTSIAVATLILLILPLLRAMRWRAEVVATVASGTLLGMVIVAMVLASQATALLPELNPRGTLQTRGELWRMVAGSVAERPLYGYGFDAFWQDGEGPDAAILEAFPWGPQHAHNGFLNAALDVGLFGLALYLVELVATFLRAGKRARDRGTVVDLWLFALLLLTLGLNVTYSNLLGASSFYWLLYLLVAYSVRAPLGRRRLRSHGSQEVAV